MAVESIVKTLGSGSGIDIGALVTSLVDAQFSVKNKQFEQREEKLEAQISGVSALKSSVTNFDNALKALTKGGTLATAPVSADPGAVKVSLLPDASVRELQTAIGVMQLASAQASTTNNVYARDQAFRTGTLTLRFGRDQVNAQGETTGFTASGSAITIDITSEDATLEGIAGKINAADAGVTATLVNDGDGARLTIKGRTGADQAFQITGTNSGLPGGGRLSLASLNVSATSTATTTSGTRARDAVVTLDGARFSRSSNTVTDLIPGLKLELLKVTAAPVALSAEKPSAALSEAVSNFVGAYNEMLAVVKEQNDPFTGALSLDNAVETLQRDLSRLTTTPLIEAGQAGAPRMLADLGVATARDGTLSVDPARLAKAIAEYPQEVEAMFAPARFGSTDGLSAALSAIAKRMTDGDSGLNASVATYDKLMDNLEDAKAKAAEQAEALRERLTRQFATMDARTAAYKSTQTFLDNQIRAWNRSDD